VWPSPPAPDELPAAAWVLAGVSLVTQLVTAADHGLRLSVMTPVSMLIGVLLVTWFARGVLTGRTGRLVVVWFLVAVTFFGEWATLVDTFPEGLVGMPGLELLTTLGMIAALVWFVSTPYFAWQRSRPSVPGPSLAGPLLVAALVGALAGMVAVEAHQGVYLRIGG
jgi:hypothetical protein